MNRNISEVNFLLEIKVSNQFFDTLPLTNIMDTPHRIASAEFVKGYSAMPVRMRP